MTALQIAALSGSLVMSLTKERSILRGSMGKRWRELSQESPVPKSSSARVTAGRERPALRRP
jgi:hypothetical protein